MQCGALCGLIVIGLALWWLSSRRRCLTSLASVSDMEAERSRIQQEIESITKEISPLKNSLDAQRRECDRHNSIRHEECTTDCSRAKLIKARGFGGQEYTQAQLPPHTSWQSGAFRCKSANHDCAKYGMIDYNGSCFKSDDKWLKVQQRYDQLIKKRRELLNRRNQLNRDIGSAKTKKQHLEKARSSFPNCRDERGDCHAGLCDQPWAKRVCRKTCGTCCRNDGDCEGGRCNSEAKYCGQPVCQCPDGWKLQDDSGNCKCGHSWQSGQGNAGECGNPSQWPQHHFKNEGSHPANRWAGGCKTDWENRQALFVNETAPYPKAARRAEADRNLKCVCPDCATLKACERNSEGVVVAKCALKDGGACGDSHRGTHQFAQSGSNKMGGSYWCGPSSACKLKCGNNMGLSVGETAPCPEAERKEAEKRRQEAEAEKRRQEAEAERKEAEKRRQEYLATVRRPQCNAVGGCPDGWKLWKYENGTSYCSCDGSGNKSTRNPPCGCKSSFGPGYNTGGWASGCGVKWSQDKKLCVGERAPK